MHVLARSMEEGREPLIRSRNRTWGGCASRGMEEVLGRRVGAAGLGRV